MVYATMVARANGSSGEPEASQLPDKVPQDAVTVETLTWKAGEKGAETVLYKLVGGGHAWPSVGGEVKNGRCSDFDGITETIAFFTRNGAFPSRPKAMNNISYGTHERNCFDLFLAESETPAPLAIFIHGGGYLAGDKSSLTPAVVTAFIADGISVAALNYRYSTTEPYPGPMLDCARAVQFLRFHAAEYNLDPMRFGAWGGSAGAGISMWLGYHDDLAKADAKDTLEGMSTRLLVVGCIAGQPTLDPRTWNQMFREYGITDDFFDYRTLLKFYGITREQAETEEAISKYEDASMINRLTSDDPPIYMQYGQRDVAPKKASEAIHHPAHGKLLMQAYDKLKLPYILRIANDSAWKDGKEVEISSLPTLYDYMAEVLRK